MKKIRLAILEKQAPCTISIGQNLFAQAAQQLARRKYGRRYAVITDTRVKAYHSSALLAALRTQGLDAALFSFPAGDKCINIGVFSKLHAQLCAAGFHRDSAVIALGGGVVGDLAGFVAATYNRGIPFIQIPTTTVAQTDSSIGGKTGANLPHGKNLVGAFHHPKEVFIDIKTLETLDDFNYRTGLVEMIKHSIIYDQSLFAFITANISAIIHRRGPQYSKSMQQALYRNCRIKADVVMKDDREKGLRKILNYGHTLGHALEKVSAYTMNHGEAVAIGMCFAAFLSLHQGYCSRADYEQQLDILKAFNLPISIPSSMCTDALVAAIGVDKKVRNAMPEFVFLQRIGTIKKFSHTAYTAPVSFKDLRRFITQFRR